MGTRDRIMGDCTVLEPMEDVNLRINLEGRVATEEAVDSRENSFREETFSMAHKSKGKFTETSFSSMFSPNHLQEKENPKTLIKISKANDQSTVGEESVDIMSAQLIDIMKIKFNEKFQNFIFSTCPIIPRFHTTFGEPLDR